MREIKFRAWDKTNKKMWYSSAYGMSLGKFFHNHNLRDDVIIEVSGGINPENIVDYLLSEPDVISSGQLTQFPSEQVDFSLRFD